MIRIAIIGCGLIAPAHTEAFVRIADAQVVAAVNRTRSKAKQLAATYDIPDIYSDYRAVLARADIDAVAILTGNESHRQISEAAAAAGKHILLEKPMALNLNDAQAIVRAGKQHGVKLMVGQTGRYLPINRGMKTIVERGDVGRPVYLHTVWNHGIFWGGWRIWQIWPQFSGGHIVHNGVHTLDLAAWLLDDPIKSVYTLAHRVSSPELETQQDFRLMVRCQGGALALLETSYALPTRESHYRTTELIGDGGRATHSTMDDGLLFQSSGIEPTAEVSPDAFYHQNLAFINYLQDGGPAPVSGEDGIRALAAALAARRSWQEVRPVEISEMLRDVLPLEVERDS
ncbi:MAG: Gfo/Idh/MocA family oxidoreductase [Chloroflexi bacterium]|nr:Gfo/Idh/MocA family oxidoreductase [Chloroflexota bacterium]